MGWTTIKGFFLVFFILAVTRSQVCQSICDVFSPGNIGRTEPSSDDGSLCSKRSHHALLLSLVLSELRRTLIDWDKKIKQAGCEARNSSLGFQSLSATACSLSLFNVATATQFFFFPFHATITRWLTQISPLEVTCRWENVWKALAAPPPPLHRGRTLMAAAFCF